MADKLPLTANLRWFQVGFGAYAAILTYQLARHFMGVERLGNGGLILRFFGLGVGVLVFFIYLQNVYRFGLVPDYSKKCRFCNGPVNRYSEFCEHCGADLIAPDKLVPCPKCGIELYEGTKHCPECGVLVAKPAKGKKGHKKRREAAAEEGGADAGGVPGGGGTASVGWSTPIDAVTGFPDPQDERERPR